MVSYFNKKLLLASMICLFASLQGASPSLELNNSPNNPEPTLLETTRATCGQLFYIINEICILQESFNGTFTELDELEQSLCTKFQETWTILAALVSTTVIITSTEFNATFTAIEVLQENICDKFEQTWTILGCFTTIPLGIPTTITIGGSYCLTNDIIGTIIIDADNVFLDLNKKKISGNIVVNTGHENISISNGLMATANRAIEVINGNEISISSIDFSENITGIFIETTTNIAIINCNFSTNQQESVSINDSSIVKILSSRFFQNSSTQLVHIFNSNEISLSDLFIGTNTANNFLYCINLQECSDTLIENCSILSNQATTTVVGINLDQTIATIVQQCSIETNSSSGHTRGILLNNCQDSLLEQNFIVSNSGVLSSIGVEDFAGLKTIVSLCQVQNNFSSTGTSYGISFINSTTSSILNNQVQLNIGSLGGGIILNAPTGCIIQSNYVNSNSGGSSVGISHPIPPANNSIVWSIKIYIFYRDIP